MKCVPLEFLLLWILFQLSDTGQVPVVVTLANSAPSSSDLVNNAASNSLHIDLERIKNNTRRLLSTLEADLTLLNQTLQSDGEVESTHLPHLSTLAPPGGDNVTSGPGAGLLQQEGSKLNDTGGVASPGLAVQTPSAEDIPSFREWTQKQLAEAEKKKGENLTVLTPVSMKHKKIRSKNYASPDCGAKIVGANPEAKSPNSVLSPSRDEYILSPCTSKIWFAVELCESIQAKKIELANFELFSSSPREFTVSVSDRWTSSKDWTVVGQFVAKDERTVQSFPLSHSLFAKYVKLEFHSHYGAEHFCPVSLLRVFGTSELDVLDSDAQDGREELNEEEEEDDGEEEEGGGGRGGEGSGGGGGNQNIFGSARDAVISIVKKAAEALTPQHAKNQSDPSSPLTPQPSSPIGHTKHQLASLSLCTSPAHIIVCDNCTDDMFHLVHYTLSCHRVHIEALLSSEFINRVLRTRPICAEYGLDSVIKGNSEKRSHFVDGTISLDSIKPNAVRQSCARERDEHSELVTSLLGRHQVAALCNVLAVMENRVVRNETLQIPTIADPAIPLPAASSSSSAELPPSPSTGSPSLSPHPNPDDDVTPPPSPLSPSSPSLCTLESSLLAYPRTQSDEGGRLSSLATLAPLSVKMSTTSPEQGFGPGPSGLNAADRLDINPTRTSEPHRAEDEKGEDGTRGGDRMTGDGSEPMNTGVRQDGSSTLSSSYDPSLPSPSSPSTDPSISLPPPSPDHLTSPHSHEDEREGNIVQKDSRGESIVKDVAREIGGGKDREESLETLFSELEAVADSPPSPSHQQPPPQQLKESVLIRLANRIKSLERNMSLSGQYLDELSRRYKRQIEELSRALAEALAERKRGEVREAKLSYELSVLAQQLATLTVSVDAILTERESWLYKMSTMGQHTVIILIELAIFFAVLFVCRILPSVELSTRKISFAWTTRGLHADSRSDASGAVASQQQQEKKRRKSDSVLTQGAGGEGERRRRPSEEAMKSSGSTHNDLIIQPIPPTTGPAAPSSSILRPLTKAEKRRKQQRRKKEVKLKISSSLTTLAPGSDYTLYADESNSYTVASQPEPRLRQSSSSDRIEWPDNLSLRNAFEPLTSVLPSPGTSPIQGGNMLTTAMSARSKRMSTTNPPTTKLEAHSVGEENESEWCAASENRGRSVEGVMYAGRGKASSSLDRQVENNGRKISSSDNYNSSHRSKGGSSGDSSRAGGGGVGVKGSSNGESLFRPGVGKDEQGGGSSSRSASNSSSVAGTPKKSTATGFKKYVRRFF